MSQPVPEMECFMAEKVLEVNQIKANIEEKEILHGKVVDMLYFPIINSNWPDWMPLIGGREFTFFSPVFNIADSYITVAVFYIILFQRKFFLK